MHLLIITTFSPETDTHGIVHITYVECVNSKNMIYARTLVKCNALFFVTTLYIPKVRHESFPKVVTIPLVVVQSQLRLYPALVGCLIQCQGTGVAEHMRTLVYLHYALCTCWTKSENLYEHFVSWKKVGQTQADSCNVITFHFILNIFILHQVLYMLLTCRHR